MKASECKELLNAMEELEKEKGISKEYLLESLETSLVTAYKKNYDSADNVKVVINEAVELAKAYGDDNAPSFVNGVLASIVKNNNIE